MLLILLFLLLFIPLLLLWRPWPARYSWGGRFRGRYGTRTY